MSQPSSSAAPAPETSSSSSSSAPAAASSSSSQLPPTGQFAVSRVQLDAIVGVHKGTGTHTTPKLLLKRSSIVGSAPLAFVSDDVTVTTFVYALDDATVAPNWFGVAVAPGIADFTRPIVYFHPTPNQGPYSDADYPTKGISNYHRGWKELFEYVDRLGHQLAGSVKLEGADAGQVLIMPFMTTASSGNAGILPQNWEAVFTDILIDVRAAMTGVVAPLSITDVVVASFSNGSLYSKAFRDSAVDLSARVSAVWDFDDVPPVTSTKPIIRYDAATLPVSRWQTLPSPLPIEEPQLAKANDTHHQIRDFMFLDAVARR